MIKNIVFDMGNVLFDFKPDLYLEKFASNEEDRGILKRDVFHSIEWVNTDTGEMTVQQAFESAKKNIPERLHENAKNMFFNWIDFIDPNKEMEELIKEIKEKGYNIYLLSNTSEYYQVFKEKIPAIKYFDGEFVSAEHKMIKPYPDIYEKFLDLFSLNAEECFFVDDLPLNIRGARKAGINATVFHGDVNRLRSEMKNLEIL